VSQSEGPLVLLSVIRRVEDELGNPVSFFQLGDGGIRNPEKYLAGLIADGGDPTAEANAAMRATLARGGGEATARRWRRYQDRIRLTGLRRYAVAATFLLVSALSASSPSMLATFRASAVIRARRRDIPGALGSR
jgi:hypothetical protein